MQMRKVLIAAFIWALLVPGAVPPAQAGVFATEVTQILNHIQLVLNYTMMANQLATQIKMMADAVKNTTRNPHQVFWNIQADLGALAGVVQGGRSLAYSLQNFDSAWHSTYPGYVNYQPMNYYSRYSGWLQTTLDTVNGAMRAANMQGNLLNGEISIIKNLEGQSASADGRLLALNVATQMADQQAQQMQKLREIMMADLQAKSAYYGTMIQIQADQAGATKYAFGYQQQPTDTKGYLPGWN
jgi:P-type conjugative transfer protein TrbJ